MKSNWRVEALQLTIIGGMFVAAAFTWPSAPDRMPIHWNAAGEIDGYGGKFQGLLLVPSIAVAQYLLLRFLPRTDPGRANYVNFQRAYDTVRVAVLVLLAIVYGLLHLYLRGRRLDVSLVVPLLIGTLLVVLGNTLGKLRPNWFFGIRTPWTLSSKEAWTRTHRVGGWLMVALGVAMIVAAPFAGPMGRSGVVVAGALGFAVWSMGYSYWAWRHDPHKVPPAGTSPSDRPDGA